MRTISADDLATIWPEAVVVDVRSAEEYAAAHIPGSRNIRLNDLASRLKDDPASPCTYCAAPASAAAKRCGCCNERGYTTVNVAGGITEWYRNGHPVTYAPPATEHPEPAGRRPLAAALTRIFKRTNR